MNLLGDFFVLTCSPVMKRMGTSLHPNKHRSDRRADLLAVSTWHNFLNEHHWSLSTVSPALDDNPQAGSFGDANQLNDAVTGERSWDDAKHD